MSILIWWGLVFGLCLLVELSSPGYFFFLSFSVGSLAAALAAWNQVGTPMQGLIFVTASAGAFFLLRSYVDHIEQRGAVKTNVYALHGKKGVVLEEVGQLSRGWVKVDGEIWAAMPFDEHPIEKGSVVKVLGSAGSHLTVKKLENNA